MVIHIIDDNKLGTLLERMILKVILNILHSDNYSDYLFQTAALTNRRIVPLVEAGQERIAQLSDVNTRVLRCERSRKEWHKGDSMIEFDEQTDTLRLFSRSYLDDDGTIDSGRVETIRSMITEFLEEILLNAENQQEVFVHFFPLLWAHRNEIYKNPQFFFVPYPHGDFGYLFGEHVPLGCLIKAIEKDAVFFRLRLGGGCDCSEMPLLIDYKRRDDRLWHLQTWCPSCNARRTIKTQQFERAMACDNAIEKWDIRLDKGQGMSSLTLFDVIDSLQELFDMPEDILFR